MPTCCMSRGDALEIDEEEKNTVERAFIFINVLPRGISVFTNLSVVQQKKQHSAYSLCIYMHASNDNSDANRDKWVDFFQTPIQHRTDNTDTKERISVLFLH